MSLQVLKEKQNAFTNNSFDLYLKSLAINKNITPYKNLKNIKY
jgi:hypothetical protein